MWFIKLKYRHQRAFSTLRSRASICDIMLFLCSLPFRSWKDIEKIKIERIG